MKNKVLLTKDFAESLKIYGKSKKSITSLDEAIAWLYEIQNSGKYAKGIASKLTNPQGIITELAQNYNFIHKLLFTKILKSEIFNKNDYSYDESTNKINLLVNFNEKINKNPQSNQIIVDISRKLLLELLDIIHITCNISKV